MNDCIFCKIIKEEIPSYKIYEDEMTYAFLDIAGDCEGHTLVIPKAHVADSAAQITGANSGVVARCFEVIARIAAQEGLVEGFRVITNAGAAAGQTVPHLHFHILAGCEMAEKLI